MIAYVYLFIKMVNILQIPQGIYKLMTSTVCLRSECECEKFSIENPHYMPVNSILNISQENVSTHEHVKH